MLCQLVGWTLGAVLMAVSWLSDRKSTELAVWSVGFCIVSFGIVLQAIRGQIPENLGIGIGGALVLFGSGLVWIGFRIFDGFSRPYWSALAIPALWLVCYLGMDFFSAHPNHRIILYTTLTTIQVYVSIESLWRGWLRDRLPARIVLLVMLISYGAVMVFRVPLVVFWPVTEINGVSQTAWFGLVTFILYVNSLGIGIGIFALNSNRSLMQYKHASEVDMLTGVLNRRAFYERTQALMSQKSGVLALMDIDYFKRINDFHGHAGGDLALTTFAETVSRQLEPDMIFGRLGGEEFALFIPGSQGSDALAFCEVLRQSIATELIRWNDDYISMTISIGLCDVAKPGADLDAVLARADAALYLAKDQGRDRCVLSSMVDALLQRVPGQSGATGLAMLNAMATAMPEPSR
ncbi:hypothetical protein BJF91_08055 [Allorhizobium taibaishanense]|uniref:diguanylate cyclase n=2 Tax=Allorhizobium taibaishanense TaxID=887144 RepID=A0A1Q9A0Q8_9HYPH|nr:hypothetical protein BJF91_08055 [Allorhizobium taibaishanense]